MSTHAGSREREQEQRIQGEGGWSSLRHRRWDCGGCGQTVARVGLTELVYTFEPCDCDTADWRHLEETPWHRDCFRAALLKATGGTPRDEDEPC